MQAKRQVALPAVKNLISIIYAAYLFSVIHSKLS